MAKSLDENTGFNISIKTLGGIAVGLGTVISMWFVLQADIAEARDLPIPPKPDVTRMEFDMKDQMIRNTIINTEDKVDKLEERMIRMEDKIDKLK